MSPERCHTLLPLLAILALAPSIHAYGSGAPDNPEVCASMEPGHPAGPQVTRSPFKLIVDRESYTEQDNSVRVTIISTTNKMFRGFLIEARRVDPSLSERERNTPVGYFQLESGTQTVCGGVLGNALTHVAGSPGSDQPKTQLTLTWRAIRLYGHIEFRATIAINQDMYWIRESSKIVVDESRPIDFTTTQDPTPTFSLDLEDCGKTKGCYRYPPECSPQTCEMVVTWRDAGSHIAFEMAGNADGWVAVGFSEDKKMGKDDVVECRWVQERSRVEVFLSKNKEGTKSNEILAPIGLSQDGGFLSSGRIMCQFVYQKEVPGQDRFDLEGQKFHLLLARGPLTDSGAKAIHEMEPGKYPYVSPQKVSLVGLDDITETARYPLVKAHACLMLIAWMMCATTAILMAKYYKPMWPNDRLCRERVWFAVHRGCMIVNVVCTIIAFILIFVHVRGYSWMPELPGKAHPPLGIVTTILCVLNPLIALCRCSKDHECRPVFNWVHWFIGTVAFVLQTPTIFIGLNLPKAHVPWWATWVLVSFLLFHLIIELLLEIHGCMISKKQKVRNEEFELRKRSDPRKEYYGKEPEPVGKRFKRNVLTAYLIVVIVLGLVMVIAVAVG